MLRFPKRGAYRCDKIDPLTGQRCKTVCTRAWNLERHKQDQHKDRELVFMYYNPTAAATKAQWTRDSALTPPSSTPPSSTPPSSTPPWPVSETAAPAPPLPRTPDSSVNRFSFPVPQTGLSGFPPRMSGTPVQHTLNPSTLLPMDSISSSPERVNTSSSVEELDDQSSPSDAGGFWTPRHTNSSTGQFERESEIDEDASDIADPYRGEHVSRFLPSSTGSMASPERQGSIDAIERGRTIDARLKQDVPTYLVKRSKKTPGQQRGIDWLTNAGKAHCEGTLETLLAQWGVKPGHRGTCVLLPEDWKAMDPIDLMTVFRDHRPPVSGSSRAWYAYSDHATSLARARAWYQDWPRTGVQLDSFLGCGPFKPMDGSHLCHQEHCIVHVVYESAALNLDRWNCCLKARFLRQDGRDVPNHCTEHQPPCLMQHAALTSREAYYIQFAVLRQAKGIPAAPPIPRPRRFHYPTLESRLPSSFPAVTVDPNDLVQEAQPAKKEGRPDLLCAFCPFVKAYANITGYWGHLVNKHREIDEEIRLGEVHRTAALWRAYWEVYSDGGKYSNPTMAKLLQIDREGFGWQQVEDWGLRP